MSARGRGKRNDIRVISNEKHDGKLVLYSGETVYLSVSKTGVLIVSKQPCLSSSIDVSKVENTQYTTPLSPLPRQQLKLKPYTRVNSGIREATCVPLALNLPANWRFEKSSDI